MYCQDRFLQSLQLPSVPHQFLQLSCTPRMPPGRHSAFLCHLQVSSPSALDLCWPEPLELLGFAAPESSRSLRMRSDCLTRVALTRVADIGDPAR